MPSPASRTPPRRIALAGASGLVGRALLAQALKAASQDRLHLVVRRSIEGIAESPRVTQQPVDFAALPALPPLHEAWCALGTTIRQAGSEAAFRAVDFDAVLAFARAVQQAGASRFAVVSALGADPGSRVFYNRVKGEMEQALAGLGFATLVIARPSLLIGDRAALGQPSRLGERLAQAVSAPLARLIPARVRPIKAETVARGMLAAMRQPGTGVRILESAELQALGT
jgi:uncharacterized protein YbjT (DUF2867 family)